MSERRTGAGDDRLRPDGGRGDGDLTDLEGIGPARADKLRDAGFESVADLRGASHDDVADVLGSDLADRVIAQVDTGEPDDGPAVPDDQAAGEPDSGDGGPSVPSGGSDSSADDSGPSVPSSSGGESTVEAEATSTSDRPDQPSTGGQSATTGTSTPTTGGSGATTSQGTTQTTDDGNDAIIAGLVSFFIPGVGNMINGQTERGAIILVVWIVWLVLGWGIGVFVIGGIIGFLTLGIGFLLIALIVSVIEFLIHVLAALDAYRGTSVVDNVEGKVNQVRGN